MFPGPFHTDSYSYMLNKKKRIWNMAQTLDVHCTLYTYSNELAPDHLLGSVHWTLDTVQLASVMVCSVHTYKDAFKPQALGHQWTLSNQLRPLPQELFCVQNALCCDPDNVHP